MGLLTTGFAKSTSCTRSAGIKTIWATDVNDVVSFTKNSAGIIFSTVTLKTAITGWRKFEFQELEAELTEVMSGQDGAFQWAGTIEFKLPGMNSTVQAVKKMFASASGCGMILIVELISGVKFVMGYTDVGGFVFPAKLTEDNTTSGKALTDHPGSILKIAAIAPEPMWTYSGTVTEATQ